MFVVSLEDCRHVAWIQTHIVKRYSRKNVSSSSKIPLSLSLLLSPSWGKKTFTLMKLHPHLWTAHFPCIQIYIPLDFHTILPPAPIQCKWGLVSSIVPQLIHYSCGVLLSRGEFCSFAGGWSPLIYVCFMQSWCLPAAQQYFWQRLYIV